MRHTEGCDLTRLFQSEERAQLSMGKAYAYGSNITSLIYSTALNKYCKMFKYVRTAEGVRLYRTIYSPGEEACLSMG
jgi:hypothetical protein